jgi:hypothetical protein
MIRESKCVFERQIGLEWDMFKVKVRLLAVMYTDYSLLVHGHETKGCG